MLNENGRGKLHSSKRCGLRGDGQIAYNHFKALSGGLNGRRIIGIMS
jgi:hypothetical protein